MEDHKRWTVVCEDEDGKPTVRYRIDSEVGIIFLEFFGVLSPKTIADYRNAIQRDADYNPAFRGLYDLSLVDEIELSVAEAIDLAKTSPRQGKQAIVMGSDFGRQQYARMYKAYVEISSHRPAEIFASSEEALAWLDA